MSERFQQNSLPGLLTIWSKDMKYLIAIIAPPISVLLCGKYIQALLNFLLTLFLIVPGIIHALLVVHEHYADKRANRLAGALGGK